MAMCKKLFCKPKPWSLGLCCNVLGKKYFIQTTNHMLNWNFLRTITTGNSNILFSKYYEVLQIERNATQDEIKKAYIKYTKEFHPDSHRSKDKGFNQDEFLKIREAYDILGNPISRKMYDLEVFGRSPDLNRFSTGEYELYSQKLDKMKKKKSDETMSYDKNNKLSGLFTVSPRMRKLLNYLYGFIFATTISMYLLGQHSKKDNEK